MAKVLSGHKDGKGDASLLDACLRAVEIGNAIFPISLSIYVEILKIRDHQRRCDLRRAIELLGRYMVVTSRAIIATHEIEALLDRLVGSNPKPINMMNYLDWGVFRAIGMDGSLRVKSADGTDVTEEVRRSFVKGPRAFDKAIVEVVVELNRKAIDGPSSDEAAELRERGYNPTRVLKQYEDEAANEVDFVHSLNDDPHWRLGRLRDAVSAREVIIQILSILKQSCDDRGVVSFESLLSSFPSVIDARRAFDAMPSFDVSVTLKTSIHKNPKHRWSPNDVHDLHAMATTLPYCDIVVTDRAMTSHILRTGLTERLNTVVLRRLEDLPQHL